MGPLDQRDVGRRAVDQREVGSTQSVGRPLVGVDAKVTVTVGARRSAPATGSSATSRRSGSHRKGCAPPPAPRAARTREPGRSRGSTPPSMSSTLGFPPSDRSPRRRCSGWRGRNADDVADRLELLCVRRERRSGDAQHGGPPGVSRRRPARLPDQLHSDPGCLWSGTSAKRARDVNRLSSNVRCAVTTASRGSRPRPAVALLDDHGARCPVDDQLEDIRAGVVPGHVQLPTRTRDECAVQLGIENRFLLARRSGHELPVGIHDHALSRIDPPFHRSQIVSLERQPIGNVALMHWRAAADHVASPLLRDMAHGGQPRLTAVPRRCGENLEPPRRHRVARHRQDRSRPTGRSPPVTRSGCLPSGSTASGRRTHRCHGRVAVEHGGCRC